MSDYRWEIAPSNAGEVHRLQQQVALTDVGAMILSSRGITAGTVEDFLQPALRNLSDPYNLPGTERAAARPWEAVQRGETILIHGDYDTDGITSAVLVSQVLSQCGGRTEVFLPHRIDDGYGLTAESIDKACCEHHSLLVTVDCGINSIEAVEAATRQGIDVLVTDHHEPGEEKPAAVAVIDPKLPGADARIQELAGVGVAFKVCHAFLKYGREHDLGGFDIQLEDVLDLVALGTVADIVPLLDENRTLVRHGLEVLSRQHRPGVRALCELAKLDDRVKARDIAYRLAPRLNASGRIGDATLSKDLLLADNMRDAYSLAERLDEQNRNRQGLEADTFTQAEQQIEEICDVTSDRTIVVAGEDWHQGVLGIVAARLARRFHRPCIVLTRDINGFYSGSGRSVSGVNLVGMLEQCQALLTRYGGHPMAAGLSFLPEHLASFREEFEKTVRENLTLDDMRPRLEVCGEVTLGDIDELFLSELELIEPFGQGNPEPVLMSRRVTASGIALVGNGHTRGLLHDDSGSPPLKFIAFGRTPDTFPDAPWDVAFRPQLNTYNGYSRPQACIVDVRRTEV
ncbi:MAG: single-stranded-DNA-specific exonuclease RecJ [Candidatus Pacebacteria bacterium]|nr:single-stranded-DNA-specific exonuclease RecJ [Candidatus Paceibacterota bacterium]